MEFLNTTYSQHVCRCLLRNLHGQSLLRHIIMLDSALAFVCVICTFYNSHTKESKDWLLGIGEAASLSRTSLIPRRYPIIPSDTFLGGWCIWEMTALRMSETQNALVGDRACPDTRQEATDSPNGTCGRLLVNHLNVVLWSCSAGYTPCKSPKPWMNIYCSLLYLKWRTWCSCCKSSPWMEPTCVACAMITCTVN